MIFTITNKPKQKLSLLLLVLCSLTSSQLYAQSMYSAYFHNTLRVKDHTDSIHTAVFPRVEFQPDLHFFQNYDGPKAEKFIPRKFFNQSLFHIEKADYSIYIDPLVNFSVGQDEHLTWQNTRGYYVRAELKDKLFLRTWFKENQARLPFYLDEYRAERKVIPGEGLARAFGDDSYDFATAGATLSYKANKYLEIHAGNDRNFIGQGYRSMFLGNTHFTYPFLRLQTNLWKFRYTNLYMALQDINPAYRKGGINAKKYASMHMLTWQINKKWSISAFEAVVIQDSSGTRGLDVHYWNPIIFYRPIDFSMHSPDNMLMGISANFAHDDFMLYGQFLIDEFTVEEIIAANGYWANKWSWQLGAKYELYREQFFGQFRLEANSARPYMYTAPYPLQNYAHYGEALAHPLGANFTEILVHSNIYYKRWQAELKFSYVQQGLDSNGSNWGADIWQSYRDREMDYGNTTHQGVLATYLIGNVELAYTINPMNNLQVYGRLVKRASFQGPLPDNTWIALGLRTNFFRSSLL